MSAVIGEVNPVKTPGKGLLGDRLLPFRYPVLYQPSSPAQRSERSTAYTGAANTTAQPATPQAFVEQRPASEPLKPVESTVSQPFPRRRFSQQTASSFGEANLPYQTQRALQAFADNTPSPQQQLGIELAGIDTYV